MQSVKQKWIYGFVSLMFVGAIACQEENDSLTDPSTDFSRDLSGTWVFSGSVARNSCAFTQGSSEYQVGAAVAETVTLTQTGESITGLTTSSPPMTLSGTVQGNSASLTGSKPDVISSGGCMMSFRNGIELNRDAEDTAQGTLTTTVDPVLGDCATLNLPCAILSSGTWTRESL